MLSLWGKDFLCALLDGNIVIINASNLVANFKKVTYYGEMAEWSIASDLKSDELNRFREFESHSLLFVLFCFLALEANAF